MPGKGKIDPESEKKRKLAILERDNIENSYLNFYCRRDYDLGRWLLLNLDSRICGYVIGLKGVGLSQSIQQFCEKMDQDPAYKGHIAYVEEVSRRSSKAAEIEDLYWSIEKTLYHAPSPSMKANLRDLREMALSSIHRYEIKLLIIGNAEDLSLSSFIELARLSEREQIAVVLVGTPELESILDQKRFIDVHNSFLHYHHFLPLTQKEVMIAIEDWERKYLEVNRRLNLTEIEGIPEFIFEKTQGLIEPLYSLLKSIVIMRANDTLEGIETEISAQELTAKLSKIKKVVIDPEQMPESQKKRKNGQ